MFEALKKLWNKQDPLVTEPVVVKTNISEPVISFVNAIKKDPKRFILTKAAQEYNGVSMPYSYSVTDKKFDKSFSCQINEIHDHEFGENFKVSIVTRKSIRARSEPWLTDEEVLYIVNELEKFFKDKVERVKAKIEKRARERLTKLYKGE